MATAIAMLVGGAIVNGLAFTGSQYMFHAFDKPNSDKERKRHDLAIEQLNRDTELWNEERKRKLDFINEELMKRNIAARDLSHMDDAMRLYNALHANNRVDNALVTSSPVTKGDFNNENTIHLPPKPTLSQYYEPSEEQRKYEYLWILIGTGIVGFLSSVYL